MSDNSAFIETFTGKQFHFLNAAPEEFDINDIAHSLAYQCRFNGHPQRFFSVAEHCVLMADYALRESKSEQLALDALMHDSTETYFCDLPSPIKAELPRYKALEQALDQKIARKFRLTWPRPVIISEWDSRILLDERAQVMKKTKNDWGDPGLRPLGVKVNCWTPETAEWRFRMRYFSLKNAIADEAKDASETS